MGRRAGHPHRGGGIGGRFVRPLEPADRERLVELTLRYWGSTRMAARERLFDVTKLAGFVAVEGDEWLGHVGYQIAGAELEVAILRSYQQSAGAGSALVARCAQLALERDLGRLWLVTTNDNVDALRFYQRRGFRLTALRPDAVTRAREQLKPEIPMVGDHGIPLRDELELELPRREWPRVVERYSWPAADPGALARQTNRKFRRVQGR